MKQEFLQHQPLIEKAFWLAGQKSIRIRARREGKPVEEASVLATVPMWFGLLDENQPRR